MLEQQDGPVILRQDAWIFYWLVPPPHKWPQSLEQSLVEPAARKAISSPIGAM